MEKYLRNPHGKDITDALKNKPILKLKNRSFIRSFNAFLVHAFDEKSGYVTAAFQGGRRQLCIPQPQMPQARGGWCILWPLHGMRAWGWVAVTSKEGLGAPTTAPGCTAKSILRFARPQSRHICIIFQTAITAVVLSANSCLEFVYLHHQYMCVPRNQNL